MMAYAAIDLRGGRVVQLVGGRVQDERVSLPDPVAVAQRWQDAGFPALHVVDLDAALGSGDNRASIEAILNSVTIPVQVGGGLRADTAIERVLEMGATRAIVGTRAVEDTRWRRDIAERFPQQIVLAADVRAGRVVTRGWQETTTLEAAELLEQVNHEPLAAVLVTDVSREGQMLGVDVELFTRLASATVHPLLAAGGIRDAADLHALSRTGVSGAVLGMALYQGAIAASEIVPEFAV